MHVQFNCYTVMFISSFSHVRLSLDNKRLLTYLVQENKHTETKYKYSTGNKHAKTKYKSDKVKQPKKTAKPNYPGSVASYDTRQGNEVGLFYNDNTYGP